MVAGALHQLTSAGPILKIVVPSILSGVAFFVYYKGIWGNGRTMNEEWYNAGEAIMESMPRQGSDTPVKINPFSAKNNMHYSKYLV